MSPARFALVALFALVASSAHAQLVGPRDFPSVDFGRLNPGDPVPDQPGHVFQHNGHGWIIAASAVGPTLPAVTLPAPPTTDEWVTEAHPDVYGGASFTYLRRTADASHWLVLGQEYETVYQFKKRPIGIAQSSLDGRWYVLSEVTQSGGLPSVGTVLRSELYAPRGAWWPVTR